RLLQQLSATSSSEGWHVGEVQPVVSIGSHPGYGVVSLVEWRPVTGANGSVDSVPGAQRIGIGLLLAGGTGMPRDLQTKFELFEESGAAADGLVVLWPRPPAENLAA